jgi:hypothetical protein
VRDGRDVACSYYDYYCRNKSYEHSFSVFLREFLNPSFDFGSWPVHVIDWLKGEAEEFLVIKYEDLYADTYGHVAGICEFLGLEYSSDILRYAIDKSTRRKIAMDAGKQSVGLSKGPGVWVDFFDKQDIDFFFEKAGYVLERAGYSVTKDSI